MIDQSYQYTEVINRQIVKILEEHFGGETKLAPPDKDLHEATDFQVYKAGGLDIAVRMRNYKYINYRRQITFRLWTNDTKTEWQKVCEGFGNYLLYGFVKDDTIVTYKIVNLDDIRALVRSQSPKLHYETHDNSNNSGLVAIDVTNICHFTWP